MKSRSVTADPREGDVIKWQGWRISVLRREGDQVTYRAVKASLPPRSATVGLADWKVRAKGAQVAERGGNSGECLVTGWVAGPCMADGVPIQGAAHIVDLEIRCGAHCRVCQGGKRAA